jgi:hypothetical protein
MDLIQNAIKVIEKGKTTYVASVSRHHFNQYTFADGSFVFVDGGNDYCRRGGTKGKNTKAIVADFCLTRNDSINTIKEKLLWGTSGPKGDQPTKYVPLSELETDHLNKILDLSISPLYAYIIGLILNEREQKRTSN